MTTYQFGNSLTRSFPPLRLSFQGNHTCQAAHSPVLSLPVHSQPAYNGPPVILLLMRGIYQSCFMITMIAAPKDSAFQWFMMATTLHVQFQRRRLDLAGPVE